MVAGTTYLPAEAKALPHQGGISSQDDSGTQHGQSCQSVEQLSRAADTAAPLQRLLCCLVASCTLNFLLPLVSAAS